MSSIKRWDGSTWVEHTFKAWNGSSWAAAQAKVWNGTAGVAVPPDVVTTVFDVIDYGAVGDGTTDDSAAIEDAFLAAHANSASGAHSKVLFPPGTYLVAYAGRWNMPTIRTNDWVGATPTVQRSGIVTLSGYGATIKYENGTGRFCWLQAWNAAYGDTQYKTHGNLVIEGFTIDNNYRQPAGDAGTVFWIPAYYNTDNVTVKDVTMTHVTARTVYNQSASVMGVYIQSNFTSRSQAHTSYITDITVDGCTILGQAKPLAINVDGSGGESVIGTNPVIIDDILIKDSTFDSCHFYGSNTHIGAHASGRHGHGHELHLQRLLRRRAGDQRLRQRDHLRLHLPRQPPAPSAIRGSASRRAPPPRRGSSRTATTGAGQLLLAELREPRAG